MMILIARDSSGARVGLHYFTDPKLIAAGICLDLKFVLVPCVDCPPLLSEKDRT